MNKEIRFIGIPLQRISERKLPKVKEVMRVFFYQLKILKYSIKQSAKNSVDQVIELWRKNQIPTSGAPNAVKKFLRYHSQWLKLQKNFDKKNSAQNQKEMKFQTDLEQLFDIVSEKSLKVLDDNIRKLYLDQKFGTHKEILSNNVPVSNLTTTMMGIDESNLIPDLDQPSTSHAIVPSEKSESFSMYTLSGVTNFGSDSEYEPPIPTKRAKLDVLTPEVIFGLDRANVSSRNAMFIIAPVLLAVGIKIEDTTLSYSSIQRARMLQREDIAKGLNDNFKTHDKYVVHWDGKMLNDLVGSKSVERLPVILTAFGTEQLLGVPKMNSGTADNQTSAILSTLSEWGITNYVKAMCFDTTAVNTGIHNGTCKAIEKTLGRELIWLPCRHHIFEIILRSAFEVYWPVSSGPNVPIYKAHWRLLVIDKIENTLELIDPYERTTDVKRVLKSFITYTNECNDNSSLKLAKDKEWTMKKERNHPFMQIYDKWNSAIYVCYFIRCVGLNINMDSTFDPGVFRKDIVESIMKNSENLKNKCIFCLEEDADEKNKKTCTICNRWLHFKCISYDQVNSDDEEKLKNEEFDYDPFTNKELIYTVLNDMKYQCRACKKYLNSFCLRKT
ncbi:uncharacterized protein LOC141532646 [Cotesia typhae]|uniref:uncharacterized protein LOC141532646 n=1 Tax=Cotesia typhae TaxID=2053667 RepID=UPI003D69DA7B